MILKVVRFLLAPFSLLYTLVTNIRNRFYDSGIFEQYIAEVPVIAVGNLSVGGTGKTPQIEYLIRQLQNDYEIAVLSRGYKRASEGFVMADATTTVADLGDEPFQFFQKFTNITVAVDADRKNGIQQILKHRPKTNLILLDDAFQHRRVKAGFYILLTAYDKLYTKDFVLPSGTLREARKGARRANAIIVTKCPSNISAAAKAKIKAAINPLPNQIVLFSSIGYAKEIASAHEKLPFESLSTKQVLLITGIAKPAPLVEYLKKHQCQFEHMNFPDHHDFSSADLKKIQATFNALTGNDKLILTTEKDFTRLQGKLNSIYSLGIETVIDTPTLLDTQLKTFLS